MHVLIAASIQTRQTCHERQNSIDPGHDVKSKQILKVVRAIPVKLQVTNNALLINRHTLLIPLPLLPCSLTR